MFCLTSFILFAIILHFVFLSMPEQTEAYYEMLASYIDDLEIAEEGFDCFTGILKNNIQAMGIVILYGFVPFIPMSIIPLCVNILALPALSAYYVINGISGFAVLLTMIVGIVPHGIFEIPAICLAVAAGLNLSRELSNKIIGKDISFKNTVKQTIRIFILYIAPMTVIAALIEAYITPAIMSLFM